MSEILTTIIEEFETVMRSRGGVHSEVMMGFIEFKRRWSDLNMPELLRECVRQLVTYYCVYEHTMPLVRDCDKEIYELFEKGLSQYRETHECIVLIHRLCKILDQWFVIEKETKITFVDFSKWQYAYLKKEYND